MVTLWYHYASYVRQDFEDSKSYRIEFLCKANLGFVDNRTAASTLQPLIYLTWSDPVNSADDGGELDRERVDELYDKGAIEWTRHESYYALDTSFYVKKDERDMRAIMDWIGCPEEISTREFFQFLQTIMVKYKLSNHGTF